MDNVDIKNAVVVVQDVVALKNKRPALVSIENQSSRFANKKSKHEEKEKEEIKKKSHHHHQQKVQSLMVKSGFLFQVDFVEDANNPQMVSEYVDTIYNYMTDLENLYTVNGSGFLEGECHQISPKMRSILIDWLVEVHQQFQLLQETLYLTVNIIDRFLARAPLAKSQLQLLGITATLIAAKYEEMYPPLITDFVYVSADAYTDRQIRQMEIRILTGLEFNLGAPLPIHFLRRYSKVGQVQSQVHMAAKYFLELAMLEYHMVGVEPSKMAAAALLLSMKGFDNDQSTLDTLWTDSLQLHAKRSVEQLKDTMEKMDQMVKRESNQQGKKQVSVRRKFSQKAKLQVANLAQWKVGVL